MTLQVLQLGIVSGPATLRYSIRVYVAFIMRQLPVSIEVTS